MSTLVRTCFYMCMYAYMCVHMRVCMYECGCACMYACACMCKSVCMRPHTHVCVHRYACACTGRGWQQGALCCQGTPTGRGSSSSSAPTPVPPGHELPALSSSRPRPRGVTPWPRDTDRARRGDLFVHLCPGQQAGAELSAGPFAAGSPHTRPGGDASDAAPLSPEPRWTLAFAALCVTHASVPITGPRSAWQQLILLSSQIPLLFTPGGSKPFHHRCYLGNAE